MPSYKEILNKADKNEQIERNLADKDIIKQYQEYYNNIISSIDKFVVVNGFVYLYNKKFKEKLFNLKNKINQKVSELNKTIINYSNSQINSQYNLGIENILSASKELNVNFTFVKDAVEYAKNNNEWLELLKDANANLISNINYQLEYNLRQNTRQEVIAGLIKGKPYSAIQKEIKNRFEISATRAGTIARTEMHKAQISGRLEGINRAGDAADKLGLEYTKIWRHYGRSTGAKPKGGYKPRADHVAMDGKAADKDGIFVLPSGVKTTAPGLSGEPSEDINCTCSLQFQINFDKMAKTA